MAESIKEIYWSRLKHLPYLMGALLFVGLLVFLFQEYHDVPAFDPNAVDHKYRWLKDVPPWLFIYVLAGIGVPFFSLAALVFLARMFDPRPFIVMDKDEILLLFQVENLSPFRFMAYREIQKHRILRISNERLSGNKMLLLQYKYECEKGLVETKYYIPLGALHGNAENIASELIHWWKSEETPSNSTSRIASILAGKERLV